MTEAVNTDELQTCPLCGALPIDWVDNPYKPDRLAAQEAENDRLRAEKSDLIALDNASLAELYEENATLRAQADALAGALDGVDDDYMTSDAHHPHYVLIPKRKFDQLRQSLATHRKANPQ